MSTTTNSFHGPPFISLLQVEEKRRYLGGDSEHTVLVKGLDFALLEQARAREAAKSSLEDEELLENAFHAAAAGASQASEDTANAPNTSRGKKRTREDIIRELKEKRGESVASEVVDDEKSKGIEERKQEGKFKPIGFKPVGGLGKKAKEKDSVKKKKRKVDADTEKDDQQPTTNVSKPLTSTPASKLQPSQQPPEPINDDDIFADAGEYEGLNLEDDDEDDGEEGEVKGGESSRPERAHEEKSSEAPRKWIDDDDEMAVDEVHPVSPKTEEKGKRPAQVSDGREDEDERESERAVRLAPLQSSAVPSIRDILAADAALEAQEMRKARKEKRKAGGGEEDGERGKRKVSAETKLNREIKKLKAYTEKKDK